MMRYSIKYIFFIWYCFLIYNIFLKIVIEFIIRFFYAFLRFTMENDGNRRECSGNSRKANGVVVLLCWLIDFLEYDGNFRRNILW